MDCPQGAGIWAGRRHRDDLATCAKQPGGPQVGLQQQRLAVLENLLATCDRIGEVFWRVRAVENGIFGVFSEPLQYIAQAVAALPGDFNGDTLLDVQDIDLLSAEIASP